MTPFAFGQFVAEKIAAEPSAPHILKPTPAPPPAAAPARAIQPIRTPLEEAQHRNAIARRGMDLHFGKVKIPNDSGDPHLKQRDLWVGSGFYRPTTDPATGAHQVHVGPLGGQAHYTLSPADFAARDNGIPDYSNDYITQAQERASKIKAENEAKNKRYQTPVTPKLPPAVK